MEKKPQVQLVKTTLRLPQSLLNQAKHRAVDDGVTLQDVVTQALENYLSSKKGGRS